MTPNKLRETWSELLAEGLEPGGDFRLRAIGGGPETRVYAAVSVRDGLPGLLLELPDSVRPRRLKPLITKAFQMQAPAVTGLPVGRWGLVIQLRDQAFRDLFEILAAEVLAAIGAAPDAQDALNGVLRCVNRWRRFVERRGEPLSSEEVRGLIGELVVLCRCVNLLGGDAAVAAWKGPERSLRDFELADASVEVKTFMGDDNATVLISPPGQLDVVDERPVYLCAVRVTPSETTGANLGEFVTKAMAMVAAEPGALGAFEDRLSAAGYLTSHAPLYVERFVAGPTHLYLVTPEFPRIRSTEIPHGVVGVRFALRLPALLPFRTDPSALIGERASDIEGIQ